VSSGCRDSCQDSKASSVRETIPCQVLTRMS
jgi:hypothetical protein